MLYNIKRQVSYKKWRRLYASTILIKAFPVAFERTHFFLCNSIDFSCHAEKKQPKFCPLYPLELLLPSVARLSHTNISALPQCTRQEREDKSFVGACYEPTEQTQLLCHGTKAVAVDIVRILPWCNFWLPWEENVWFCHFITLRILTLLKLSKKSHILEIAGFSFMMSFSSQGNPCTSLRDIYQESNGLWQHLLSFYILKGKRYTYLYTMNALKFGSISARKNKLRK